jgi:hypothetical protein
LHEIGHQGEASVGEVPPRSVTTGRGIPSRNTLAPSTGTAVTASTTRPRMRGVFA